MIGVHRFRYAPTWIDTGSRLLAVPCERGGAAANTRATAFIAATLQGNWSNPNVYA